jgi:hypothetical protein
MVITLFTVNMANTIAACIALSWMKELVQGLLAKLVTFA